MSDVDLLRWAAASIRMAEGSGDQILAALLEVAAWLDEVAWRSEQYPKQYRAARYASAVARAYLGEQP